MTTKHTKIILILLFISIAVLGVYSNTFHVPFQYDDILLIERSPLVHSLDLVTNQSAVEKLADYGLARRRIVAFASFAFNYWASILDVPGYHVVNISIHIINSLLVFFLIRLFLRTPKISRDVTEQQQLMIPFAVAMIFAVHPVQIEAVTYIYQRIASLITMFFLAAVICYLKFRLVPDGKQNRAVLKAIYYIMALVFVALAVSTKENALTLPFVILLLEMLLFSGPPKRRAIWGMVLFVPLLMYVVALQDSGLSISGILFGAKAKQGSLVVRSSFDSDYLNPGNRRYEYLVSQFRVMLTYFRLLVLPINQNIAYDYPVYRSLFVPQVLISLLVHAAVLIMAALAYVRSRKGVAQWVLVTVGILWFYFTIALESSIIPLPLLICEYRLYLPGIGLFLAMISSIMLLTARVGTAKRRIALMIVFTLAISALGTATYVRNNIWRSRLSLWSDVIQKAPDNEKGYINTGSAYMVKGDMRKALDMYLDAYRLNPMNASTNYNLGVIYRTLGNVPKAIEHYNLALKSKPNYVNALYNLANAYMAINRIDEAINKYEKVLTLRPYLLDAHINLSVAYRRKGDKRKSLLQAEIANRIRNSNK